MFFVVLRRGKKQGKEPVLHSNGFSFSQIDMLIAFARKCLYMHVYKGDVYTDVAVHVFIEALCTVHLLAFSVTRSQKKEGSFTRQCAVVEDPEAQYPIGNPFRIGLSGRKY